MSLISKAFSPPVIAEMERCTTAIAHDLLDEVVESGRCDLVADFAGPLPVQVMAALFAIPCAMRERFVGMSAQIVESAATLAAGDHAHWPDGHLLTGEVCSFFVAAARERAQNPGPDLISRLTLAGTDFEQLSVEQVARSCIRLIAAGSEATNLLATAIVTLLAHPDQLGALRRNPVLVSPAIEEVLRFGYGTPFCAEALLARLEARVGLIALLERLPNLRRADSAPLEARPGLMIQGCRSLPLRFNSQLRLAR